MRWQVRRSIADKGSGLSTISFLIGPSTERSSVFSSSGTLNLFSVATKSPTNASKSAFEIPASMRGSHIASCVDTQTAGSRADLIHQIHLQSRDVGIGKPAVNTAVG